MRLRDTKRFTRPLTVVAGSLFAIAAGFACLNYSFAEALTRTSYDLPFVWRSNLDTHEVVLVYLDEESAKQLQQPIDDIWNRALHVPLLERLTKDGASLIVYDIVFDTPSPDPTRDAAFAGALQSSGKAILGGMLDIVQPRNGVRQERIVAPLKLFRKAAAGWGIMAFKPVDADYAVRQLFPGTSDIPTGTWKAAEVLGAKATREPREARAQRWVNYYGPKNTFSSVNLAQALDPQGVPTGFFKDKIVMVGGRSAVSYLAAGRDEFATPYSRGTHQFTTGLEVHATVLLNLLHGEWLTHSASKGRIDNSRSISRSTLRTRRGRQAHSCGLI